MQIKCHFQTFLLWNDRISITDDAYPCFFDNSHIGVGLWCCVTQFPCDGTAFLCSVLDRGPTINYSALA